MRYDFPISYLWVCILFYLVIQRIFFHGLFCKYENLSLLNNSPTCKD